MDKKYTTASGIEIPVSDAVEIAKKSRKETLKNVFAVIGVGSTLVFLKKLADGKTIKIPNVIS